MHQSRGRLNLSTRSALPLMLLSVLQSSVCLAADWHAYDGEKVDTSLLGSIQQIPHELYFNANCLITSVDGHGPPKGRWYEKIYLRQGTHRIGLRFVHRANSVPGTRRIEGKNFQETKALIGGQAAIHSVESQYLDIEIEEGHVYVPHAIGDLSIPTHWEGNHQWYVWIQDESTGEVVAGDAVTEQHLIDARKTAMAKIGIETTEGLSYAAGRFLDPGDGTIHDTKTGLVWEKGDSGKNMGMSIGGSLTLNRIQKASKRYVKSMNTSGFLGRSDWRIPSAADIESLDLSSHEYGTLPFVNSGGVYKWRWRSGPMAGTINWDRGIVHKSLTVDYGVLVHVRLVRGEIRPGQ